MYGISSKEFDQAFKYLEDHSDCDTFEIAIVNEKDRLLNVLVYIDNGCMNEKFGYDPNLSENNETSTENDEQSSTATTVKEQEQSLSVPEKQTNNDILSTNESISDTSVAAIPEQSEAETEGMKYS